MLVFWNQTHSLRHSSFISYPFHSPSSTILSSSNQISYVASYPFGSDLKPRRLLPCYILIQQESSVRAMEELDRGRQAVLQPPHSLAK